MSTARIPADLPADAVGFIARRADRPERLALFRADGTLSNSFGRDETLDAIRASVPGLRIDAAGFAFRA